MNICFVKLAESDQSYISLCMWPLVLMGTGFCRDLGDFDFIVFQCRKNMADFK